MIGPGTGLRVYLACGATEMRKGIAGLVPLTRDVRHQKRQVVLSSPFAAGGGSDQAAVSGWPGFLALLQSAGARLLALAKRQGWRGADDLRAARDALGGDRLAAS